MNIVRTFLSKFLLDNEPPDLVQQGRNFDVNEEE